MEGDKEDRQELHFEPRAYQLQLEEVALEKNTIIHLPTGSGKTLIAAKLITRLRSALQKPWKEGGKRTFFLVNVVALVHQQQKVIKAICPVTVGGFSSEDKVDFWDKSKWDFELSKYQVIVMTSQILVDMITHNYISLTDINLIIFDECHHAVDDHPMRRLMKKFEECLVEDQPRVLGLTATLLNRNVPENKIQQSLRDLETTFHATIATVNASGEVECYSTNPYEVIVTYKSPDSTSAANYAKLHLKELIDLISGINLPKPEHNTDIKLELGQLDISSNPLKIAKAVKNMIVSMIEHIDQMGVYGGSLCILAYIILFERVRRKASTKKEELLYNIAITHSHYARMLLLQSMQHDDGYEKIVKHSSEQIIKLINIVKEYNPAAIESHQDLHVNRSGLPLSAIIFTKMRFTAKILYNILKEVKKANPAEFSFLNHDFIVGFNINPMNNTREDYYTKKASQAALLKFANKDLNCLIATSVIEEGIDVSQCLLVVRYDAPSEYRSYVQSKGRCRSKDATYVIMVNENNKLKFQNLYASFLKTEKCLQALLVGNSKYREAPTEVDLQNMYGEDDVPPYITSNGKTLSAVAAPSLLSRYCSVLPHDQFTVITPVWLQKDVPNQYYVNRVVTIIMPLACPLKEPITGDPYPSTKKAKQSAALKACIKLHQIGQLDPSTLLPVPYGVVDFDLPNIQECFPNWPWNEEETVVQVSGPRAGTKNRKQKHPKMFPSFFMGPSDWVDGEQTLYLHIIKLSAAFEEPKQPREKALYNLIKMKEGYGFLTFNPLPKICNFPMFLTTGEVRTTLDVNYAKIPINLNLFELIKRFHYFIFDQVLGICKKFVVFDGTINSLYVVPIVENNGYDIDWSTMQSYEVIPPLTTPSLQERKELYVDPESYKYAVVSPWYRGVYQPDRYIVSNVLEYKTPQSQFDSEAYDSFEDYFSKNYNLDIAGSKDQPLLEVRNISTRMNCILPRAATIDAFTDKEKKIISEVQGDDKPKTFNEIFIPEYCIKYDFPGVLWYKAMILPSIIHRIQTLYTADELRMEIAKDTNYGVLVLPKDEEWQPIEVTIETAVHTLRSLVDEPAAIPSIDRINNPIGEDTPKPVNIVSMKESLYSLMKQKISKDFPWDDNMEPLDVERNITTATLMDVACYDEFVSAVVDGSAQAPSVHSPNRPSTSGAILPTPLNYNDKILLLSKQPTGRGPELKAILAALTTINSHDTFDLERVETLGDSFLKFAATLYLFHKFPTVNEGHLTNIKGRLIGNRNLYYAGKKKELGGRMKIEQFSPRKDFLVPGFFAPKEIIKFIEENQVRPSYMIGISFAREEVLSGQLYPESFVPVKDDTIDQEPVDNAQNAMQCYVKAQVVSDKTIADCVEALIGTYLLSGGVLAAVKIVEWFQIIPPKDNFASYLHRKVPTPISKNLATSEDVDFLLNNCRSDIENILDYKFNDPSFILEALSHPSYIRNRLTSSYQRLEFLGDAILDFLITSHIFEHCRELRPGDLTDLRSALVNNVTFASYVVKLGLQKHICSQLNPVLDKAIITFVEHQEQRNHEIEEEVIYLIDEEECNISEYVEVPKVLSDIFESLAGAIFLDSGGSLPAVWKVFYKIMCREIDTFSARIPRQPVRVLYECIHACPVFHESHKMSNTQNSKIMVPVTITNKTGKQHTVYGFGGNKFEAKRAAAKIALRILNFH